MKRPRGNGSGKFEIGAHDMGGWVRVIAGKGTLPEAIGACLSQHLAYWFRDRPQLRLRFVVPINRDGTTIELHGWYDVHLLPPPQPPEQPDWKRFQNCLNVISSLAVQLPLGRLGRRLARPRPVCAIDFRPLYSDRSRSSSPVPPVAVLTVPPARPKCGSA